MTKLTFPFSKNINTFQNFFFAWFQQKNALYSRVFQNVFFCKFSYRNASHCRQKLNLLIKIDLNVQ